MTWRSQKAATTAGRIIPSIRNLLAFGLIAVIRSDCAMSFFIRGQIMISEIWKNIKKSVRDLAPNSRPNRKIVCRCKSCGYKFPAPILGICPRCGSGYLQIKVGEKKS